MNEKLREKIGKHLEDDYWIGKNCIGFPAESKERIKGAIIQAIEPLIRQDERERIFTWLYEICPHNEAYEKRECDACWQALKATVGEEG